VVASFPADEDEDVDEAASAKERSTLATRGVDEPSLRVSEIAAEAGTDPARVEELLSLGLIGFEDGALTAADVGRVQVIEAIAARGVSLEDLATASREGAFSFRWFGGILPPPPQLRDETYEEMFARLGVGLDLVVKLFEVWGVAMPELTSRVRSDDARLFSYLGAFASFAGDPGLLVEGTRYFGDSARGNSMAQIDFFRRQIVGPLIAQGKTLQEAVELVNPLNAEVLRPGVQELMLWLHRRHIDAENMQMLIEMVESAMEGAGVATASRSGSPAIVFVDISGFTSATDSGGDDVAVQLASRLSDVVRPLVTQHGGTVVKFLGDGVMLHFPAPGPSVDAAMAIVDAAPAGGLPPLHAGVATGALVFRDGDYFGHTVNVASRLADAAEPGEVLISADVAAALGDGALGTWIAKGQRSLKGLANPVEVFSPRPV
jgi:adenylate cyclase